jgi:hypothetical protein
MAELIEVKCVYTINENISKYAIISTVYDNLYDIKAVSRFYEDKHYHIYKLKYEDVMDAGEILDEIIEKEKLKLNNVTKLQSMIRGYVCRKRHKKIMINNEMDKLIRQYCDGFLKDIKLLV